MPVQFIFFNSFIANKTPVFDQVLYMPEYQKHLAGPDSPFPTHFTGQVSDQPIYAVPHESLTQGTGIDDVAVDKLLNGRQFTPYK